VAVILVFVIIRIYLWIRDLGFVHIEIVVLIVIVLGFHNSSDLGSAASWRCELAMNNFVDLPYISMNDFG
jgi:hypothetical protein